MSVINQNAKVWTLQNCLKLAAIQHFPTCLRSRYCIWCGFSHLVWRRPLEELIFPRQVLPLSISISTPEEKRLFYLQQSSNQSWGRIIITYNDQLKQKITRFFGTLNKAKLSNCKFVSVLTAEYHLNGKEITYGNVRHVNANHESKCHICINITLPFLWTFRETINIGLC